MSVGPFSPAVNWWPSHFVCGDGADHVVWGDWYFRGVGLSPSYMYICIYTPKLGLETTVSVRDREQGRFRGSREGVEREQGRMMKG